MVIMVGMTRRRREGRKEAGDGQAFEEVSAEGESEREIHPSERREEDANRIALDSQGELLFHPSLHHHQCSFASILSVRCTDPVFASILVERRNPAYCVAICFLFSSSFSSLLFLLFSVSPLISSFPEQHVLSEHTARYQSRRNAGLSEVQRLEAAEERRAQEKERRMKQERARMKQEQELVQLIVARNTAKDVLATLPQRVRESWWRNERMNGWIVARKTAKACWRLCLKGYDAWVKKWMNEWWGARGRRGRWKGLVNRSSQHISLPRFHLLRSVWCCFFLFSSLPLLLFPLSLFFCF